MPMSFIISNNNNNNNNNKKDRNNQILQRAPTGCAASALITVLEAILTGRQTREKLQCLYENIMSHNFRKAGCSET